MSRITDWVLDMEDNGEIELVETTHNCDMGWVYTDTGKAVSITQHEYVAVDKEDTCPK